MTNQPPPEMASDAELKELRDEAEGTILSSCSAHGKANRRGTHLLVDAENVLRLLARLDHEIAERKRVEILLTAERERSERRRKMCEDSLGVCRAFHVSEMLPRDLLIEVTDTGPAKGDVI